MKTITSTRKSAAASLNQVIRHTATMNTIAKKIKANGPQGHEMAQLRGYAEKVLKAVHEHNAYTNVLVTE